MFWSLVLKKVTNGTVKHCLKVDNFTTYSNIIGWDMTEWDPQVRSRVNRPYPGYPFLILHSHIGHLFVFFANVRSNALNIKILILLSMSSGAFYSTIYTCQPYHVMVKEEIKYLILSYLIWLGIYCLHKYLSQLVFSPASSKMTVYHKTELFV
jgi:hypothetical protein